MDLNMDPAIVENERAAIEEKSIGPHSSALLLQGDAGPAVFLGVDWNDDLDRVVDAVKNGEEIDVGTQWGAFKQDGDAIHMALVVDWPDVGAEIVLYFNSGQWDVELQGVHASGKVFIHRQGISGREKLEGALGIEVPPTPDDLLALYLRMREEAKAE